MDESGHWIRTTTTQFLVWASKAQNRSQRVPVCDLEVHWICVAFLTLWLDWSVIDDVAGCALRAWAGPHPAPPLSLQSLSCYWLSDRRCISQSSSKPYISAHRIVTFHPWHFDIDFLSACCSSNVILTVVVDRRVRVSDIACRRSSSCFADSYRDSVT